MARDRRSAEFLHSSQFGNADTGLAHDGDKQQGMQRRKPGIVALPAQLPVQAVKGRAQRFGQRIGVFDPMMAFDFTHRVSLACR